MKLTAIETTPTDWPLEQWLAEYGRAARSVVCRCTDCPRWAPQAAGEAALSPDGWYDPLLVSGAGGGLRAVCCMEPPEPPKSSLLQRLKGRFTR